jgi:phosphoglycerate dehydrogenase-like enzyme
VTNWGDAPAGRVAEGALTLLLAVLKDLPGRIRTVREGGWRPGEEIRSGLMEGLEVGVYGCGAIGRRFLDMLVPLGPNVRVFDPYAEDLPEGAKRAGSLEELFRECEAVGIYAGLNAETRGAVTAELLAVLPDGGILINTARGEIVDQDALFRELESGRLRAGLDVLYEEPGVPPDLPRDHPARTWPNAIITAHSLSKPYPASKRLLPMHRACLENLRAFVENRPLRFTIDRTRYDRST